MKISKIESNPANLSRVEILLFSFALILFLYLKTFYLPATPFLTLGDEAHYFLHALRILHGELPYRDFFTFIFPGTDLLYAGIFRLLGVHQWLVQAILLVLGLCLAWVVLWISSRVLSGSSAILAAVLFLVIDFNSALDATHHWWSTLFVLIAVGFLLRGRSQGRILAAGISCGIAALFTQMHGGLALLAFGIYLSWTNREDEQSTYLLRELLLLCMPFVAVLAFVVGPYAHMVGLRTIAYWTIYFPVVFFHHNEGNTYKTFFQKPPMHGVGDLVSLIPYLFIHAVLPLIYVLCTYRLVKNKKSMRHTEWRNIFLLTSVGTALFVSVMSAPTFLRLCVVAPPAVILCVWLCERTGGPYRRARTVLWIITIFAVIYLPIARQLHRHTIVSLPTGSVALVNDKQYEKIWWLAQHTNSGDTFFNDPTMAFALSLESPGPLDFVTPSDFTRPQQVNDLLSSMTRHRTRYIFLYPELNQSNCATDNLKPFRQYVATNYHLARVVSGGEIWQRNGTLGSDQKAIGGNFDSNHCVGS
jgi:hypothetical protein